MLEIVMLIASFLYTFGALVFIVNCSLELASDGRTPSLQTLAVSALWPLVVVVTVGASLVGHCWARSYHLHQKSLSKTAS